MTRTPVAFSALLLVIAMTPHVAEADAPAAHASPPASTVTTPPVTSDNVRRVMGEVGQILGDQRSARQSMLAALTPAHRTLLGQIIGELAIAPEPDFAGAARRLSIALSARETQTIVGIEQAKNAALLTEMQQVAASSGSKATALPPATGSERSAPTAVSVAAVAPFGSDAGSILLRTAAENLLIPNLNLLPQLLPAH